MKILKSFKRNESGATAIEYGLIAALIAVAAIAAFSAVGDSLDSTFTQVSDCLNDAGSGTNCNATTGGSGG